MAVAPVHGRGTRVLVDELDLSNLLKQATVSASQDAPETTVFGSTWRTYANLGLREGTFAFDGLFSAQDSTDSTSGDIANFLDGSLGGSTKHVITLEFVRGSTGGRAAMMLTDITTYDYDSPVDGLVTLSVDTVASSGYAGGVMLRPLSALTAAADNTKVKTPGTTSAGGTTGGGVGHLHITDGSTFDLSVKIQHSTSDGSTWADLITFSANSTEPLFQRSTVAGAVKEVLRSSITTSTSTGTETANVAVAFSRKTART